jgi:septation ring formation regulator EzrA
MEEMKVKIKEDIKKMRKQNQESREKSNDLGKNLRMEKRNCRKRKTTCLRE